MLICHYFAFKTNIFSRYGDFVETLCNFTNEFAIFKDIFSRWVENDIFSLLYFIISDVNNTYAGFIDFFRKVM